MPLGFSSSGPFSRAHPSCLSVECDGRGVSNGNTDCYVAIVIGVFHKVSRPRQAGNGDLQPEWHEPRHRSGDIQQTGHCGEGR